MRVYQADNGAIYIRIQDATNPQRKAWACLRVDGVLVLCSCHELDHAAHEKNFMALDKYWSDFGKNKPSLEFDGKVLNKALSTIIKNQL